MSVKAIHSFVILALLASAAVQATETENLNLRNPARSGEHGQSTAGRPTGTFRAECSSAAMWRTQRDKMSVWIHAMYDADNLYVLARWLDEDANEQPGSIAGDYGWAGDCLQAPAHRGPETSRDPRQMPICWVTAWRDRDGKDAIDLTFPNKNE